MAPLKCSFIHSADKGRNHIKGQSLKNMKNDDMLSHMLGILGAAVSRYTNSCPAAHKHTKQLFLAQSMCLLYQSSMSQLFFKGLCMTTCLHYIWWHLVSPFSYSYKCFITYLFENTNIQIGLAKGVVHQRQH